MAGNTWTPIDGSLKLTRYRWLTATGSQRHGVVFLVAIGREAVYVHKHDVVLWLADKRLFAYDCGADRLRELDVALPDGLYGHECALVYDRKHDVCVALIPKKFSGPMQTFLFRPGKLVCRQR